MCKLMHASWNFKEPLDMQPIPVEGIFHKVGIDMIGPLQTSASGNCNINTEMHWTTAEFFDREVICRQSTTAEAVSDRGGEF